MASIRSHRGKYQVRYRVGGRMRSKTFARLGDARKYANRVEAELARGDYIDPRAGLTTFVDYADRWLDLRQGKARSTLDRDRSYLRSMILPTFGTLPVASIKPTDVEAWVVKLGRAPSTTGKALSMVKGIFDMARRDNAIRSNPADGVKVERQERRTVAGRALSDDGLAAVLGTAEQVDRSTAAMVWVMARCGLRIGEAMALRRRDIDFAAGTVNVARSMSRKEGARPVKGRSSEDDGRVVPMPTDVANRLRLHMDEAGGVVNLDGLLFTTRTGRPISYTTWRSRRWVRIVETAGVGSVRPHDLRHTAATRLYTVDRWTPAEVQAFLGHTDPRLALAIYTHVDAACGPCVAQRLSNTARGVAM